MRMRLFIPACILLTACSFAAELTAQMRPFESVADPTPRSRIDELVFSRLAQLGIQPAHLCSDAVFIRRAYLDVIGTLPSAQEARDFLLNQGPYKRRILIDQLLERPEFSDYWAMKWSDLLRIKAEFPINLWPNAAQAYHRWIRASIRDNKPYDRFVRELLTESGSNFRVPPVNFYRALQSKEPEAIAQAVALTFLGMRTEKWSKTRLTGLAAFFSQIGYKPTAEWKEEIVFFDPSKAEGALRRAVFPDSTSAQEGFRRSSSALSNYETIPGPLPGRGVKADAADQSNGSPPGRGAGVSSPMDRRETGIPEPAASEERDPREVFADWLIDPKNLWFTQNIVNRVWSWLLGRGIIHEPDDVRPDNPPSNPELLAYLEQELISAHYDLKHIYRIILNSKTYQLSSIPKSDHPEGEANFAHYPLRRLEAEVLIDALNQITGTTEKYSSAIPEPFTFIPENQRSIALPDGSITSAFLEMFGRPPRDTGLESERNNRPTAAQRLHLLNSSHIQRKIEQSPKLQYLLQPKNKPPAVATGLYLMILSRFPTEEELRIAGAYAQSGGVTGREAAVDLAWALINSAEFLHRH
ncbi:MAG: DUF1553 domain-containing protein [Verrucomicrobia bacterium]|nr:DUF1553 domain-containing protein [Verrucomicrobiota bacterium]